MSEGRDDSLRATAELQARRLQAQARIQDEVLDAILDFVDLPSRSGGDPLEPASADLEAFKRGVSLFRPGDFDDLVKERNIYERCGYCLCSEKLRRTEPESTHRIVWARKGGQDLKVVNDLSRTWCSKRCENLALFVKNQLNSEPAWERRADRRMIDIPRRDNSTRQAPLRPERDHDAETGASIATKRLGDLSLERGDVSPKREHNIEVFENASGKTVIQDPNNAHNDEIEGYRPKARRSADQASESDSDDGDDILDI